MWCSCYYNATEQWTHDAQQDFQNYGEIIALSLGNKANISYIQIFILKISPYL